MSRFLVVQSIALIACATAGTPEPATDAASQCTTPAANAPALSLVGGPAAKLLVSEGARLVDVRAPDFFARGHIAGAINIPVAQIAARAAAEIGPLETPVVLYCRTGAGSAAAAHTLLGLGYTHVYDLGSYLNWGAGAPAPTPLSLL